MFATRLLKQLKEEKQKVEYCVTQNGIQDFAQYKFFVGEIIGLQAAIEICRNLLKETGEIDE